MSNIKHISNRDSIKQSYSDINNNFNILLSIADNVEKSDFVQSAYNHENIKAIKWMNGRYVLIMDDDRMIVPNSNVPLSNEKQNGLLSIDTQYISGEKTFNDGIVLNSDSCIKGSNGENIITQKNGYVYIGGDENLEGGIILKYDTNGNFISLSDKSSTDFTSIYKSIETIERDVSNLEKIVTKMEE